MTLFQWCFAPLCFLLAMILVFRTARRTGAAWRALLWALVWLVGGVIILWPDLTTLAATALGIGRGTDLVLYVGALVGLYAFQRLYGRTRRLENTITEVVRRQAIDRATRGPAGSQTPEDASYGP